MKIQQGQVALITGASRGLGVYMAKAFAARGVNLVLAARTLDALESLSTELASTGVKAVAVKADMSRAEEVTAWKRLIRVLGQRDLRLTTSAMGDATRRVTGYLRPVGLAILCPDLKQPGTQA